MTFEDDARGAFRRGDTAEAERLSTLELHRAREAGDAAGEVQALCWLARVAVREGDVAGGEKLALEARAVGQRAGDRRLDLGPVHLLANCARMLGRLESARALFHESIALNQEFGDPARVAGEQHNLAFTELGLGDVEAARRLFAQARRRILAADDDLVPMAVLGAGAIAAADGDLSEAARLLGAADAAFAARHQVPDPDDAAERRALLDRARAGIGPDAFEAAHAEGATLDVRRLFATDDAS